MEAGGLPPGRAMLPAGRRGLPLDGAGPAACAACSYPVLPTAVPHQPLICLSGLLPMGLLDLTEGEGPGNGFRRGGESDSHYFCSPFLKEVLGPHWEKALCYTSKVLISYTRLVAFRWVF